MAQRWMQAKDMLGKKHGFARSGASRPTGDVVDDRNTRRIYTEPKPPAKPQVRRVVVGQSRLPAAWQPARTTFDY